MLDANSLLAATSKVKEVQNKKSITISVLVALAGLIIIVLLSWSNDKSASAYMAGNTLAIVLIIFGFYRLLFKRTQLIYKSTTSILMSGSFFFDSQYLDRLKTMLENKGQVDISNIEFMKSGNARLDYMVSGDGHFVAVQLFHYVPYTFETATEIICLEEADAHKVGMFLLANHGKF